MGRRENKIETYLNKEVKKIGGITRKWVCPGRSGVPDRIVFIKGLILFVEIKTKGGVVSGTQHRELNALSSHGALVGVIVDCLGVDEFIKNIGKTLEYNNKNNKSDA